MRNAAIRCKNFRCNLLNESGNCTAEGVESPCVMDCTYHSDCNECSTSCIEDITDDGFIIK